MLTALPDLPNNIALKPGASVSIVPIAAFSIKLFSAKTSSNASPIFSAVSPFVVINLSTAPAAVFAPSPIFSSVYCGAYVTSTVGGHKQFYQTL